MASRQNCRVRTEGVESSLVAATKLDGEDRLYAVCGMSFPRAYMQRLREHTGSISFLLIMFSTGVATGLGETVLIVGQAKPRRPSLPPSWRKLELSLSASSTAWPGMAMSATVTVSVKTLPEAEEPSP